MWIVFNETVDLGGLMACLADKDGCDHGPELDAPRYFIESDSMHCSDDHLPMAGSTKTRDAFRRLGFGDKDCPAGVVHWMLFCALQMWVRKKHRQSVLYFDHALSFLFSAMDCIEGSDWPLWPGQILRNYRVFLSAAFPPGPLEVEQKEAENGSYYEVAGPHVSQNDFKWENGLRSGLYCPPFDSDTVDGATDAEDSQYFGAAPVPETAPTVLCAVPVMWPADQEAIAMILETYGPACDKVLFFIAAPDPEIGLVTSRGVQIVNEWAEQAIESNGIAKATVEVIDLAAHWPVMLRDSASANPSKDERYEVYPVVVQKDLLMFLHAAESGFSEEWMCRIETDSYFAPANFRRFVAGRGLDPDVPHFLGSTSYWGIHFEPRIVFNEQVQCLSKAAVLKLGAVLRPIPVTRMEVSYMMCSIGPGRRGDLMLAICLAEAGIVPSTDVVDRWGREFFVNYQMQEVPFNTPVVGQLPNVFESDAVQHWKGKSHYYLTCLLELKYWVSPFPISFHNYKDARTIRWLHGVISGKFPCGAGCPEGYQPPRLATLPWKARKV